MKSNFKISHKIIAVTCSVVILLSAISSIAFNLFALSDTDIWDGTIATEYAGGSGTAEDPYLISTPEQLALLVTTSGTNTSGKYYKLTADMYLNDTTNPDWKNNSPQNWCAPQKDNFFRGNFDGNCHTVKGLYYNGSKQDAALFAGVRGNVSIKNLVISDAELKTTVNYAAAFAGQVYNSSTVTFENCYVDDTVTATASNYAAGFIGGGTCSSITFKNCASFAAITTTVTSKNRYGSFVGGLVYNNGTGDARKITYNNCIGNIEYTNYAQYPTYNASYCGTEGTVDSGNKAYPTVVTLNNMKGESAKNNMPQLDWVAWKTTEKFPVLTFSKGATVYSFEDWRGGTNDKSATGLKINTTTAKDGSKALVYDLIADNKTNYSIARVALLSEGEDTATVVAGTAYELTFWYKVDTAPINTGKFVVYTVKPKGGANTTDTAGYRKQQILNNEIVFNSATDGWVKATVKFEASLIQDDYNALAVGAVGVNGVVSAPVYIDSVTVKETQIEEGNTVFSFENWNGKTQDKSATGISFANVSKDGYKSLCYNLPANTSNYATPRVAVLHEGSKTAKVVSGISYQLNFWYKVDGTPTNKGEFVVYTAKSGGATSNDYRQVQALDKNVIFDTDTTNTGENGWVKATVKFTAALKNDDHDLVAIGIKGIGNKPVDVPIYIDAVTIEETEIKEEDIVYSFEEWRDAAGGKGSGMEISSANAKDGLKSLAYDLVAANKTNYAIARVAGLSDGAHIAKVESGYVYDLSFWYKLDAAPTKTGKFVVYTVSPRGGANTTDSQGYRKLQTLDKDIVFDNATDGWAKATVRFQASLIKDEYNCIAIGVVGVNGVVDTPVYIDAVTVEKADVEICKITAHYNDDANTVNVINAVVGTAVNIPSIERADYYIEGWYTDSALTKKFDPDTISAGSIEIYAKWAQMSGKVICDFEDYPYSAGNGMSGDCYSVVTNLGVDNSKALKYSTKSGITNWWNTRTAGIAIGHSRYNLKDNQLYKVSFQYFVPAKPDATVNVGIWAGNKTKITDLSSALQQNVSETLIINGDTPVGRWITYTASFTAKTYDPENANLNALAIGFVTGEKLSENSTVYVDNFTIEEVRTEDQSTITVHTVGLNATQVFKGVPGHTLVEPPVRKDYIFDGWYSDAGLKKPVKVVKFPESGNLDLYAKWKSFKNGDSITIGFDDYTYVSGSKQFYPWFSLDKTDSADSDGVSVKATMDSSCSTTMRLAYKGYPVLIEDGSRYLVSFSYKNIDEVPNKWSVRIYANSPLNCGVGTTQQSAEDDAYRLTLSRAAGFGTWKRHTYSFTASLKYPGHNALAINMQTNSFSEVKEIRALIDSVTIKRIEDDDIVCMTNTLTGPDYVTGKRDEKIVLPNDLKLDGYKFLGWFMDKHYALEASDALFSEDTVFYAKWARVKLGQDFEEYDYQGYGIGYDLDIEYYNNKVSDYASKNVYGGKSSIHRIGKVSSDKKFTLITDANDKIAIGETYKVTYYVKLASTKNTDQNIYVLPTDSYFYPGACDTDMAIPSVSLSELYPGVWYKITNIVTLYSPYLAIKTPGLSDIYFDNFTMELVSSDFTIDESEKVIPLGKVPVKTEDEEFENTDSEDEFEDIPIEDDVIDENVDNEDENDPPKNKVVNNSSKEKTSNNTVVILVISILAAVLVVAATFVAIYLRKRKLK